MLEQAHETTGSHTRLNIIGALSLEDIGATVTENYNTINSECIVRFLAKLKQEHYPLEQKVHLILDSAALSPNRIGDKCSKSTQYRASLFTAIQSKLNSNRAIVESNE